jgi:DNA-cytosine methyltransferase
MSFNVLSCFDGMSCGQIALNKLGIKYDNYYASEIDKNAIKVTQHNYPNTIQLGDVTKINGSDLPKIDLLIGGSPCQGFSFAGKQLNFDDPRSKLFFEFVRLKNELQPKYFLLENVKMKKEHEDVISEQLGVKPFEINSNLFSIQNRRRLYWTNINFDRNIVDKNISFQDVREELPTRPIGKWVFSKWGEDIKLNKLKTLNTNKLNCLTTSKTHSGMYYLTPCKTEYRNLSVNEARMAQTIPDNYDTSIIPEGKVFHILGNGWTVDVISHIFKNIVI